ncbi:hypothetical protein E2C01_091340 [Portunus trituberculatus]|uniref:Uncharacterized protein n=1 Tax=Portunus trituberculatus TaxID=210409 RepID=A0A5B7JIT9_PORTR|nr:hypothetical protein [Portunus trituberculatus]
MAERLEVGGEAGREEGRERRGDWQQPSPSGRRVAGNISPVKFVDPTHRNSVAACQRAAAAASPVSSLAALDYNCCCCCSPK